MNLYGIIPKPGRGRGCGRFILEGEHFRHIAGAVSTSALTTLPAGRTVCHAHGCLPACAVDDPQGGLTAQQSRIKDGFKNAGRVIVTNLLDARIAAQCVRQDLGAAGFAFRIGC